MAFYSIKNNRNKEVYCEEVGQYQEITHCASVLGTYKQLKGLDFPMLFVTENKG